MELYNLRTDIGEQCDVADQNPQKVKELAKALSDKLRGWDAPMPTVRKSGKAVPRPDELL
jgi:hypothetical protein